MTTTTATTPPRIGQHWPEQGGIYAGIMAGRDGQPDYHLIVAPREHDIESIAWGKDGTEIKAAISYHDGKANTAGMLAAGLDLATRITALQIDGHADWHLPSQAEAHLLAANVKEQMPQDWCWTSTQYSAGYAWGQYFSYGSQDVSSESWKGRAVAVRQIPVNP